MVLKFNTASAEQPATAAVSNSNGLESSLKRVSFMLSSAPYLANMVLSTFLLLTHSHFFSISKILIAISLKALLDYETS